MIRKLMALSAISLMFCTKALAACPSLILVHTELENQGNLHSPFIAVFRSPSYNPKAWIAITDTMHWPNGDFNLMITDIYVKTRAQALSIAETTFANNNIVFAFGSMYRDGHNCCGYSLSPPYIVTAQGPVPVPADAQYDDLP